MFDTSEFLKGKPVGAFYHDHDRDSTPLLVVKVYVGMADYTITIPKNISLEEANAEFAASVKRIIERCTASVNHLQEYLNPPIATAEWVEEYLTDLGMSKNWIEGEFPRYRIGTDVTLDLHAITRCVYMDLDVPVAEFKAALTAEIDELLGSAMEVLETLQVFRRQLDERRDLRPSRVEFGFVSFVNQSVFRDTNCLQL